MVTFKTLSGAFRCFRCLRFASFWQWSISLSVSSGVLCSKLLFIACVCTVTQTLAFLPSLIEPSPGPDRKLASPAAPAVIQGRLGPGSFSPFWCFRLPLSGYTHAGVSKPVCMWLTPQCKQKMFDLLTSEQGLMSGRRIAVDVQQTGCMCPVTVSQKQRASLWSLFTNAFTHTRQAGYCCAHSCLLCIARMLIPSCFLYSRLSVTFLLIFP